MDREESKFRALLEAAPDAMERSTTAARIVVVGDEAIVADDVERDVRARDRWFATTLRCIADGVITVDPRSMITFMNANAERLTGWTAADALGRPIDTVVASDDRGSDTSSPIAAALASGRAVSRPEARMLVRKSGRIISVEESAAPIAERDGEMLGAVLVLRDVGERRLLEQRLARSERLVALGTMAAGLCHEINNPLTSVLTNVSLGLEALDDPASGDDLREYLNDAREAALRIASVVRAMRELTETNDEQPRTMVIDDIIGNAVKTTAHITRQHARVELSLENTPVVDVDPLRMQQVFVNLLLNAAHAIPAGEPQTHRIGVSATTGRDGWVEVSVRDDGGGIPDDVLPRIFDPFFTTKGPRNGTGLGLSIGSHIVDSHGGELSVRSTVGVGSTFVVRLPPSPVAMTPMPKAPIAKAAARARVLIVDDEPLVREALSRILRSTYDVTLAADGEIALSHALDGEPFDLVLCDVMLPTLDGEGVLRRLLAARPEVAKRLVFITGGAPTPAVESFLAGCGRPILEKPFESVAALRSRVAELIETARR